MSGKGFERMMSRRDAVLSGSDSRFPGTLVSESWNTFKILWNFSGTVSLLVPFVAPAMDLELFPHN